VEAYVRDLQAPLVHLERLEGAGHSAVFMAARMLELLNGLVRPLAHH